MYDGQVKLIDQLRLCTERCQIRSKPEFAIEVHESALTTGHARRIESFPRNVLPHPMLFDMSRVTTGLRSIPRHASQAHWARLWLPPVRVKRLCAANQPTKPIPRQKTRQNSDATDQYGGLFYSARTIKHLHGLERTKFAKQFNPTLIDERSSQFSAKTIQRLDGESAQELHRRKGNHQSLLVWLVHPRYKFRQQSVGRNACAKCEPSNKQLTL